MHVHVSALDALVTFAYVLILGFLWRMLAAYWADNAVGKAMSNLY